MLTSSDFVLAVDARVAADTPRWFRSPRAFTVEYVDDMRLAARYGLPAWLVSAAVCTLADVRREDHLDALARLTHALERFEARRTC